MNEQYQAPQTPETHDLHHTEVKLDMHKEIYSSELLGIPAEDNQYNFSVAGEIQLRDRNETGTAIALVKALNKQFNRVELYAVGITEDEEGNKKSAGQNWMPIKPGQSYNFGRKAPNETEKSEHRVTGERLFGEEFPKTVSRSHLDLELTTDGELTIRDHSTNGTKVVGNEASETPALITEVPGTHRGKLRSVPNTELITHVPTAEERKQERVAAEQAELAEVQRKSAEILEQMNQLTAHLSEQDKRAIWQFASGTLNKRKAQQEDQEQESINQGMIANEGLRAMSPDARAVKDDYLRLMGQKSRLLK